MRPTVSQYARSLEELSLQATPEQAALISRNFWNFLKRRGETKKAREIIRQLERLEREKAGEIRVTVITAHEVMEDSRQLLYGKAKELFPGKNIELEYERDEKVIGGAQFRTDEMLYDATVVSQLKSLRNLLIKA